MYDCVYPTRTGCECQAWKNGYSRARLHFFLKAGNPLAYDKSQCGPHDVANAKHEKGHYGRQIC